MENVSVKKRKNKKIVWAIIVSVLALSLVFAFFNIISDMFWTDTDEMVVIDIPDGYGISRIATLLEEKEVIDNKLMFRLYEKMSEDRVYHSGSHKFYIGMSYEEVLDSLAQSSVDTVIVTIPEGYEMRQIGDLLEEKGVCAKDEFNKAVAEGKFENYPYISSIKRWENRLEGYLFPDTYEFKKGEKAERVIEVMLDNFDKKVYSLYKESKTEKSLDEIVIMASIVEREAANDEERGKVASVFYNRLEIGMKLQSCATVQYIIKERKKILSNEDIKIKSPYNTYVYEGLPIGPIASPGVNSVKAALYPEETDYYYFAATKDGNKNVFSKTGEEHLKTVEELQR